MFLNSTGIQHFDSIVNIIRPNSITLNKDPIYDGCGSTKFCLGFPKNCVAKKSCQAFAARFVQGCKNLNFKLKKLIKKFLSLD